MHILYARFAACPQECSVGLMQCYDMGGIAECCNFYSIDDNCLSTCGVNQLPDQNYTCVCFGFYGPPGNCSGKTCRIAVTISLWLNKLLDILATYGSIGSSISY